MAPQKRHNPWPDPTQDKKATLTGGPGVRGATHRRGSRIITEVRSLARSYTHEAVKHLAAIMRNENYPPAARVMAIKVMLDRGWGRASETHNLNINGETSLLKVVNEIVHVHETREQVEFRDQTPLLEHTPEDNDSGSKSTH